MASGKVNPSKDMMGDGSLSGLSLWKFVSSKFLGLLVEGYEKESVPLLRKLEVIKSRRVVALSKKRRPSFMFHFDSELQKFDCSFNYNQSSKKRKEPEEWVGKNLRFLDYRK